MNPVNVPDPEAFTARVQPESGPDRRQRQIRLPGSVPVPFVHSRCGSCLHRTDPDPIWMAWSGFGQTHQVWKEAGVQESPGLVSNGPLAVSHFQTPFRSSTDVPDNTVQNQPGSDLVLADCVRFGPRIIR